VRGPCRRADNVPASSLLRSRRRLHASPPRPQALGGWARQRCPLPSCRLRRCRRLHPSATTAPPPSFMLEGWLSYGHPWAHYSGGYKDRLLSGPLGLLDLCYTVPVAVKRKDYRGIVLG
jgi:hypothetical protein